MTMNRLLIFILAVAAAASWCVAAFAGEEQAPPPPPPPTVEVSVAPLPSYPQVAVTFNGFMISEDQRSAQPMKAEFTRPIFPAPGQPLAYQISVTAHGGDRTVRVTGAIRDYLEKEIRQIDEELTAADGQTTTRDVAFTPGEEHQGPFFFNGEWREIRTLSMLFGETAAVENRETRVTLAVPAQPGQPVLLPISVTATGSDGRVHVTGSVRDAADKQVTAVDLEIATDQDKGELQFEIKPDQDAKAPFTFIGTWKNAAGAIARGELPAGGPEKTWPIAVAIPSARFPVEDFECVHYPDPNAPLENSASARHTGQMGMIVRPQVPEKQPAPKEGEQPVARQSLPVNRQVPGRPVRFGLWAKASAPVRVTLNLRDPGIEVSQSPRYDRWSIGPIEVQPGGWSQLVFPAPGYGPPKWQRTTRGRLGSGFVDYPLTVETIEIESGPGTEVMIDELDVFTQHAREGLVRMAPVLDKPAGLLYRNDVLRLAITSMWLWGKPIKAAYGASLLDIAGKEWPVCSGSIDLAPGATAWIDGTIQNLPLGSYRLKTSLQYLDVTETHTESDHGYLIYEPGGKPLPYHELAAFLGNRLGVLADLGFRRDMMVVPWHSTQGTMSVEMQMGHFWFGWLDPEIEGRQKAGMEVIGKLGMTPEWADPSVNYLSISNAWAGNTTAMPAQTIWWEEYVHRTVLNFGDRIKSWIIWDRPDAPGFATSTQEYVEKMLSVAHRAAKEADPDAVIVSGGVSRENMESFLNDLIEAGAARYVDAMGILPTTAPLAPEDGYMDVMLSRAERLRTQEQFAPPLWVLDLGWPTGTGDGSVSEDNQARYLARAWAICRAFGAQRVMLEPHQMFIDGRGLSPAGMRDSADLFFHERGLWGIKPAALAGRTAREMLEHSEFIREVFLVDRWDGLSRAYLFRRPDGKLVLSVWRRHEAARLRLPESAEQVLDVFGNAVAVQKQEGLALHAAPHYVLFAATDPVALARQLERTPLDYDDAPEAAWKRTWSFFLDVGSEADEQAAQYAATKSRLVENVDSFYHNDYGRHVVDSGRQFTGDERFVVDVSSYGSADMIIRKRLNYSVPNQRVKVYCNDQLVGQWFAFKRDRRFRWRNAEFIVPNSFFAGKPSAALRFEAQECEATSYAYWIGPLKDDRGGRTKTVYASDLSLLVNNSGYGAGANLDKNILGGPIRFHKDEKREYAKGLGTNAAAAFEDGLIVIPLNKQYKRFRATVGVDAATDGRGTVRFRIGDGRKMLFDSADMTFYSDPKEVDIDVSDTILLMLSVGDCGDGNKNDIANWADARLELK